MIHATLEEQRAASRAETARAVAGPQQWQQQRHQTSPLDAMTRDGAGRPAIAPLPLDMKAKALTRAAKDRRRRSEHRLRQWQRLPERPANATVANRLAALCQRRK